MRVKLVLNLPRSTTLAAVYTAAHSLGCILRQLPDGTLIGEPVEPPTAAARDGNHNVIRFPRRRQRRANPRPGPELIA